MSAILVEDLTKAYGRQLALDGVSFEVPAGCVFGLLGPNGAGKTTLFSLVAGFLFPTRGRVAVTGKLAILPQDALFQANVPVLDQLVFFGELGGMSRDDARADAMRALELVGLADAARKNPRILSHGMAKRLGVAQALLGAPEVVLLDEPTAGLDPAHAKDMRDLIRKRKPGVTYVVSSHNLAEIEDMCSHVAILDRGKLVLAGEVAALTDAGKIARLVFARALTSQEEAIVKGAPDVKSVRAGGGEHELVVELAGEVEPAVAEIVKRLAGAGIVPRAVERGESLESRFLQLTRKSS
jgi:ABC-type multidrug transport system ATPase subunit